jgi:hypothetical protein
MLPANSRWRQRITLGGAQELVGRDKEFAAVAHALEAEHQSVVHVHGIPGIGKSALLAALGTRLRANGHVVVALDCRAIEPTGRGLLRALGAAGLSNAGRGRPQEIVALDNDEHLHRLDSWIGDELLPRHRELRLLLASRRLPHPAWITSGATFLSVRLDELGQDASLQVLQASGMSKAAAMRAYVFTRGHPMALRLAVSSGRKFSLNVPDDLTRHRVITQLPDTFLADLITVA